MILEAKKVGVYVILCAVSLVSIAIQYIYTRAEVSQTEGAKLAQANSCTDAARENRDVLFVSCGGFF